MNYRSAVPPKDRGHKKFLIFDACTRDTTRTPTGASLMTNGQPTIAQMAARGGRTPAQLVADMTGVGGALGEAGRSFRTVGIPGVQQVLGTMASPSAARPSDDYVKTQGKVIRGLENTLDAIATGRISRSDFDTLNARRELGWYGTGMSEGEARQQAIIDQIRRNMAAGGVPVAPPAMPAAVPAGAPLTSGVDIGAEVNKELFNFANETGTGVPYIDPETNRVRHRALQVDDLAMMDELHQKASRAQGVFRFDTAGKLREFVSSSPADYLSPSANIGDLARAQQVTSQGAFQRGDNHPGAVHSHLLGHLKELMKDVALEHSVGSKAPASAFAGAIVAAPAPKKEMPACDAGMLEHAASAMNAAVTPEDILKAGNILINTAQRVGDFATDAALGVIEPLAPGILKDRLRRSAMRTVEATTRSASRSAANQTPSTAFTASSEMPEMAHTALAYSVGGKMKVRRVGNKIKQSWWSEKDQGIADTRVQEYVGDALLADDIMDSLREHAEAYFGDANWQILGNGVRLLNRVQRGDRYAVRPYMVISLSQKKQEEEDPEEQDGEQDDNELTTIMPHRAHGMPMMDDNSVLVRIRTGAKAPAPKMRNPFMGRNKSETSPALSGEESVMEIGYDMTATSDMTVTKKNGTKEQIPKGSHLVVSALILKERGQIAPFIVASRAPTSWKESQHGSTVAQAFRDNMTGFRLSDGRSVLLDRAVHADVHQESGHNVGYRSMAGILTTPK